MFSYFVVAAAIVLFALVCWLLYRMGRRKAADVLIGSAGVALVLAWYVVMIALCVKMVLAIVRQ